MTLYKDKYRIESTRLKGWDYSSSGYYFVTICTKDRKCFWGKVIDGKIQLSRLGQIVAEEWTKTAEIHNNVDLDIWGIMPNHIHGILIIKNNNVVETTHRVVSTTLKPNSLGSIIGQFKSITTKRIRKLGYTDFGWQSIFHDHIIRNDISLHNIRQYIFKNPLKWQSDKFYSVLV